MRNRRTFMKSASAFAVVSSAASFVPKWAFATATSSFRALLSANVSNIPDRLNTPIPFDMVDYDTSNELVMSSTGLVFAPKFPGPIRLQLGLVWQTVLTPSGVAWVLIQRTNQSNPSRNTLFEVDRSRGSANTDGQGCSGRWEDICVVGDVYTPLMWLVDDERSDIATNPNKPMHEIEGMTQGSDRRTYFLGGCM